MNIPPSVSSIAQAWSGCASDCRDWTYEQSLPQPLLSEELKACRGTFKLVGPEGILPIRVTAWRQQLSLFESLLWQYPDISPPTEPLGWTQTSFPVRGTNILLVEFLSFLLCWATKSAERKSALRREGWGRWGNVSLLEGTKPCGVLEVKSVLGQCPPESQSTGCHIHHLLCVHF